MVGLPDTVWFPVDGLRRLPDDTLSFLFFAVAHPELFDAVVTDGAGWVREIDVKSKDARSTLGLGRVQAAGRGRSRRCDGSGTSATGATSSSARWSTRHLERGGRARAVRAGEAYVDVGTLHGYREALRVLGAHAW